MTETKHSKGPWKRLHADGSMIVANGRHIASVALGGPADAPTDNANAALIVAAPDLLAFAIEVKHRCVEAGIPGHELATWADTLIAKATAA